MRQRERFRPYCFTESQKLRNLDGDPLESLLVREGVELVHARNRVILVSIAFAGSPASWSRSRTVRH